MVEKVPRAIMDRNRQGTAILLDWKEGSLGV